MAYKKSNPNGQATMANSEPIVIASDQSAIPVSGTITATPSGTQNVDVTANTIGLATATKQDLLLAELQLKADLSETQPVSVSSLPLPTGASTETTLALIKAKTDNLDVALSTRAVTGLTDTELRATALPVSGTVSANATIVAAIPAGTNNIGDVDIVTMPNVTLNALPTGTNNIGDVDVLTLPAISLAASSNNIGDVDVLTLPAITGTVTANAGTNLNTSALALESTQSTINGKTPALGQTVMASSVPVVIASNQTAIPVSVASASVLFKGRSSTFRTAGRAGTAGQNIMSIHNATGSVISLTVKKVTVDLYQTVVKVITVAPPIIRMWKVTVLPTNGTALAKTKIGGTSTSSASVTVLGDASADGTGSATTLTATLPAGTFISQQYAPRFITAAGYETADRLDFFSDTEVVLGPLEGIVVRLDYTLATQNPVTDMWIAGIEWTES